MGKLDKRLERLEKQSKPTPAKIVVNWDVRWFDDPTPLQPGEIQLTWDDITEDRQDDNPKKQA